MSESDLEAHIAKLSPVALEFLNVEPIRRPLASQKKAANRKVEGDTKKKSATPPTKKSDSDDQFSLF